MFLLLFSHPSLCPSVCLPISLSLKVYEENSFGRRGRGGVSVGTPFSFTDKLLCLFVVVSVRTASSSFYGQKFFILSLTRVSVVLFRHLKVFWM